jgi:hypothetical protein
MLWCVVGQEIHANASLSVEERGHPMQYGERGHLELCLFPTGTSASDWATVTSFYSYWLNFSTSRSFSWADKYNLASATSRKVG